jgi:glycosyltransferase involved in cell wall biosynthesis
VFGIFGRLEPFKGQLLFLRAFSKVLERFPDAKLLICGGPMDSPFAGMLRDEISKRSLSQSVVLAGPSENFDSPIASIYAACDVIVNSRLDPEPFGLSVIEGMLMGKPLLVHASGGPRETVMDGANGWHINAPTEEAFKEGIVRSLDARKRWKQIGDNARQRALDHFTHVKAGGRILSIITEVSGLSPTKKHMSR